MYKIKVCISTRDFKKAKKITSDYIAWLGMDLSFQNVNDEFAEFENIYSKPEGCFLIAVSEKDEMLGGVGLRKLTPEICEMKRLFVYPQYLKQGIGRSLCLELILKAKRFGYNKMRLDTLTRLEAANKLYKQLGFYGIAAYRKNPDPTAKYMELKL